MQAQEPTFQFVRTHVYSQAVGVGAASICSPPAAESEISKASWLARMPRLGEIQIRQVILLHYNKECYKKKHIALALGSHTRACTHMYISAHNVHSRHVNTHMPGTYT